MSLAKNPSKTYAKRSADASFFSSSTYSKLTESGADDSKENSQDTNQSLNSSKGSSDYEFGSSPGQQSSLPRGDLKRDYSFGGSPDGSDDFDFDLGSNEKLSQDKTRRTSSHQSLGRKNSLGTTAPLQKHFSAGDLSDGLVKRKRSSSGTLKSNSAVAKSCGFSELTNSGSNRSLLDEVEFMLDGMSHTQPISIQRSSAFNLTKLCSKSEELSFLFRAHGLFDKVIELLQDSHRDEVIFMCAAAILYFLFKDKLNGEYVSSASLRLIVSLLTMNVSNANVDGASSSASATTRKPFGLASKPAAEIIADVRKLFLAETNESFSDIETIRPSGLALCTLAQLSALQVSLRDDLRRMGLLDIITARLEKVLSANQTNTMLLCESAALLETANCLRVLENVTFQNTDSQTHLANIANLIPRLLCILRHCFDQLVPREENEPNEEEKQPKNKKQRKGTNSNRKSPQKKKNLPQPARQEVSECLQLSLKVLVNLSNHQPVVCLCVGENEGLQIVLEILSAYRFDAANFDTWLLALGCLSNLLEETPQNRARIAEIRLRSQSALEFLVSLYLEKVGVSDEKKKDEEEEKNKEETEKQVEANIAAAYCSLLIGCAIRENPTNREAVCKLLPGNSFDPLVNVIGEFIGFQLQNGVLSKEAHQSYVQILYVLDPTAGKGEDAAAVKKDEQ